MYRRPPCSDFSKNGVKKSKHTVQSSSLQNHEPWSIGRIRFQSEIQLNMVYLGPLGAGNSKGLSKF